MNHTEDAVDGVAVLLSPHTSIDTSPHMHCHTRHIVQRERYRDGYISTHSHNIHPLIVTNPPTFAYLQISGQVRRSLYTGALCEGDRFTSIGHPDTPARWTHTHTHK